MTDLSQGEASALAPDNDTSAVTAVEIALRSARRGLLDLGTRNRLIHTAKPTARSKSIEIVDELSDEVFRILFDENRAMAFLPVPHRDNDVESEEPDRPVYLPPNDDEGLADRHIDSHLQTRLGRERLQNRLLSIHRDEKSLEDEQGVNVLFLALGFLHWFENDSSEVERTAPLLLLPVGLDRSNVRGQFRLKIRDEELAINLPLQQKMHADFGIYLPDFLEDAEIRPSEYLKQVRQAIAAQTRWWIADNEIILGFFSFSKYLMFRDLMPENWPNQALLESPILNQMLGVGFRSEVPLFTEDLDLDTVLDPADLIHIMDADSAQTVVIESVKQGRNLVVQGPPGTGKSQTIANVIAAAVHAGKTVFFVAGKMAALDVVQRRLAQAGLADLCLELHSRKANKKLS